MPLIGMLASSPRCSDDIKPFILLSSVSCLVPWGDELQTLGPLPQMC